MLESIGKEVEAVVRGVPGTLSAFAERAVGGNYLDFDIDRQAVARYGLTMGDVQDVIQTAMGGMTVTTTVEGLERYPVNVRYGRELRDDPEALRRVLVRTPSGQQIPLAQLAKRRWSGAARWWSAARGRGPTPGCTSTSRESTSAPT